jgi:acyl carrier protein
MMMNIDINKEVIQVLQEQFDIDPASIAPESRLREDLDLDSIDLCDMMNVIEKRTGISSDLSDFANASTYSDVLAVLERIVQQSSAA